MQHTPYPPAQDPAEDPDFSSHSSVVKQVPLKLLLPEQGLFVNRTTLNKFTRILKKVGCQECFLKVQCDYPFRLISVLLIKP